jgi:hypothetical protein
MKELIKHLMYLITESGQFGNVELFNEQVDRTRNLQTRARKKRSVYITMEVVETLGRDLGINDFVVTVRFTVGNDNKKFSKLEDIDLLDQINGVIQNQSGQVNDTYAFSTMNRTYHELDTDHDQQSEPFIEYTTKVRDYSGYRRKNAINGTITTINPTVNIVTQID